MSFLRFRRRVSVGSGRFWLNLSKRGISASVGGRGATLNSGGRATFSAPGTGLSYVVTPDTKTATGQRIGWLAKLIDFAWLILTACAVLAGIVWFWLVGW